jgi:caffeoyl-CoA O-methyltransferase
MIEIVNKAIEEYAAKHSKHESLLLRQVREFTMQNVPDPQMLSGPIEGNFLKMVVRSNNYKNILELGTYTGYSSLWMAEGFNGPDGLITTCEVSEQNAKFAKTFIDQSPYKNQIRIMMGKAMDSIDKLMKEKMMFDMVFIDADKANYPSYYEKCFSMLKKGGSIVVDNALWSGKVLSPIMEASTAAIHKLNQIIATDSRVDSFMLTIRDGVHWARKK